MNEKKHTAANNFAKRIFDELYKAKIQDMHMLQKNQNQIIQFEILSSRDLI